MLYVIELVIQKNISVFLVFGLDNIDSESDDEFEGDLNNEDDDGCNNCGDLLDEMKDKENSFDVRILEVEEAHERQITQVIKRYDEELAIIKEENQRLQKELETKETNEMAIIKAENQGLQKELETKERNEKEMKRNIDFLSNMLREADAKREQCLKAAKEKADKQNAGSSVTNSIMKIVGNASPFSM